MIQAPGKKTYGFIAQELYKVYPMAVALPEEKADIYMVDYAALTPLLVGATNELHELVKLQKKEINILKDQIDELKKMLEKLIKD